ncbi:MAG: hypothetical protein NT061_00855 [Spirochaetes bacterium]|nr:hypothetical protein [Spirochaetota bacterium]
MGFKKNHCLPRLLASIVIALSVMSCASAPPITTSRVEVELLSRKQVTAKFGIDQKIDPFIAPTGLVRGKPNDFVVLRLSTELLNATFIQLTITIKDKDGNSSLWLWSKEDFKEYWRSWGGGRSNDDGANEGEAKAINLEALIEDFYVPGESFTAPRGRSQFYIVLVGKNPLNRPLRVMMDVNAAGLAPYVRSFAVE